MFLATDDDDDASSRQREAIRRRAYLAELDAQVAMKRERERREAAAWSAKKDEYAFEFDAKHAHRSHARQYARAASAFGGSVGVLTPPGCFRSGHDEDQDDDDGSASVEVEVAEERRRVARRKASLRLDLERQIEAKRAAREAEREEMMRLEMEEERRIRMEREEMTRRMRPVRRRDDEAYVDDGDFLAMEEGDIFVEESTFVAIPEDETTVMINVQVERESVAHKATSSPKPSPSPRSIEKELGFITPVATEKPPSHDDSPPLQRQESTVKKLAAMFERAHAQD